MKILLADADERFSQNLQQGLSSSGFRVDLTMSGTEALKRATGGAYDAILLEVNLPGLDGYEVLRRLRAAGSRAAILIVTTKGQERDKLQGLNYGADDYLVKPVLLSELVARIRAILRRIEDRGGKRADPFHLRAGPLALHILKHEAKRDGKRLPLTKTEFALLECLMRRPGQVLSRPTLAKLLISGDIEATTNVLEVHVKNLRDKIDGQSDQSLIRTIRGFGYALDV